MWRVSSRTTYYLSEIWLNLRAATGMSLGAVFTIAIAVSIFGGFLTVQRNVALLAQAWANRLPIVLFLREEVQQDDLESLQNRLSQLLGVAGVQHVSKQEALEEFRLKLPAAAQVLDELPENPLPASLVVQYDRRAAGARKLGELRAELSRWPAIEEVVAGPESAPRLGKIHQRLTYLSAGIGALLALGLLLIIINTVRMTIETRKDEISIIGLVGASNAFIRLPLICEGMLQALLGGLLAAALLYGVQALWPQQLVAFLPRLETVLPFQPLPWPLMASLVAAVVFLGLVGSFVSVLRHVRT